MSSISSGTLNQWPASSAPTYSFNSTFHPPRRRTNALVSVFLRVLEYYDGILILTSNRVGTFDEAIRGGDRLCASRGPHRGAGVP